jgi:hypothetical protein
MTQPTSEEMAAWARSRCTKHFLEKVLKEKKQETLEAWAKQLFVSEDPRVTLGLNANALGGVDVMSQLIDMIEEMGAENGE